MGAKKDTYKAISAYLMTTIGVDNLGEIATIQSPDGVTIPKLGWVDKNRGQVQYLTREMGIPFPAILISFPEIEYESLGAGVKKGITVLRITSLFESFADSYEGSINQDIALLYFEFNDLVFQTLEGLSGESFSKLIRIRETEDEDHDFLIVTVTDYMTELTDTTVSQKVQFISGNPTVVRNKNIPNTQPTSESNQFVL